MVTSFLMFIFIVICISKLISFYIRKKFHIQSINPDTPINNTHKWVGRIVITLVILCLICGYIFYDYFELIFLLIGALAVFSNGFDTYMEYKHDREEKEYLVNSVSFIGSIVVLIGAIYFMYNSSTLNEVIQESGRLEPNEINELEIIKRKEGDEYYSREVTITDKQMMKQLFSELEKVEVRNGFTPGEENNNFYYIYMRQGDIFSIDIYEDYIRIESDDYKVTGENYIYELLEEANIDWKLEE